MTVKLIIRPEETGFDFSTDVFANPAYLASSSQEYGWFTGRDYVLPFYIDKVLFFRRMIFTSAPIFVGSAAESIDELKSFLDEMVEYIDDNKLCDFISKPQSNAVFPSVPEKSVACGWGTYVRNIDQTDDELLKSFHAKHRNVIVKSMKDSVTVRVMQDVSLVQQCIQETLLRQNLPYYPSLSFVESLVKEMPDHILMMGAYHQDLLQGVALVLFDKQCGYYLYGGSIPQPYGGALNLLQYEVMRYLRDREVKHYDFVGARLNVEAGSKYEGIQRFKLRFGAQLIAGHAFRVVFSPLKYRLFNIMLYTYFRLKGRKYKDAIDQIREQSDE